MVKYCRILDFIDSKVLGGSNRGKRYYLNPSVAADNLIFNLPAGIRYQLYGAIKNSSEGIYRELALGRSKDQKITITSIKEQEMDI